MKPTPSTSSPERDELTATILSARWPGGEPISSLTTRTAPFIADAIIESANGVGDLSAAMPMASPVLVETIARLHAEQTAETRERGADIASVLAHYGYARSAYWLTTVTDPEPGDTPTPSGLERAVADLKRCGYGQHEDFLRSLFPAQSPTAADDEVTASIEVVRSTDTIVEVRLESAEGDIDYVRVPRKNLDTVLALLTGDRDDWTPQDEAPDRPSAVQVLKPWLGSGLSATNAVQALVDAGLIPDTDQ